MNFEYSFFLTGSHRSLPRTPASALRGFHEWLINPEAFMYLATSVRPIDQEPYDLDEISRILAQKDLDFPMISILMSIFRKLSRDADAETALFGSESINFIESRYAKSIENLKKEYALGKPPRIAGALSKAYYELALLSAGIPAVRDFYFSEAEPYQEELLSTGTYSEDDMGIIVRTWIRLGRSDDALELIRTSPLPRTPGLAFLEAEVEFSARNFIRVFAILSEFRGSSDLTPLQSDIMNTWFGRDEEPVDVESVSGEIHAGISL